MNKEHKHKLKIIWGGIIFRIGLWLDIEWIRRLAPAEFMVLPLERTNRDHYEVERKFYRTIHFLERIGDPMDRRSYYIYRTTAQKYGWPYIKEIYDNS